MKIVLATGNSGKVSEFNQLLDGSSIEVVPQSVFQVSEVAETGTTFVENAIIKARHAADLTQLPAMADDSGLEIDALTGAPGVISARYAGDHCDDAANIQKVLQALQNVPVEKRTARFRCLLVFMRHAQDACPIICQGTWEGSILFEPTGDYGFGYDPIFFSTAHQAASAELPPKEKNQSSHRGKALAQMVKCLVDLKDSVIAMSP